MATAIFGRFEGTTPIEGFVRIGLGNVSIVVSGTGKTLFNFCSMTGWVLITLSPACRADQKYPAIPNTNAIVPAITR